MVSQQPFSNAQEIHGHFTALQIVPYRATRIRVLRRHLGTLAWHSGPEFEYSLVNKVHNQRNSTEICCYLPMILNTPKIGCQNITLVCCL